MTSEKVVFEEDCIRIRGFPFAREELEIQCQCEGDTREYHHLDYSAMGRIEALSLGTRCKNCGRDELHVSLRDRISKQPLDLDMADVPPEDITDDSIDRMNIG